MPGAGVAPFTVPVAELTSNTLGNLVFLRTSGLRAAMGADANAFAGGLFDTAAVRFADDADPAHIAEQVQANNRVVVYVPVAANLNTVDQARPIFAAVIQALLAIGAVITVLGLTSAVILHTRTRAASAAGASPRRSSPPSSSASWSARCWAPSRPTVWSTRSTRR